MSKSTFNSTMSLCIADIVLNLPLKCFDSSIANAAEFDSHGNSCTEAEISHFHYHLRELQICEKFYKINYISNELFHTFICKIAVTYSTFIYIRFFNRYVCMYEYAVHRWKIKTKMCVSVFRKRFYLVCIALFYLLQL